CQQYHELLTF
nr:immunoglobulin light chain junction region [Macaca mulatta]MOY14364.1 immunoglobulin light chain junction region [Macaca mulatta]